MPKSFWTLRHPHTGEYRVGTFRGKNDDNLPENDPVFASKNTHEDLAGARAEADKLAEAALKAEHAEIEAKEKAKAKAAAELAVVREWKEV